MNKQSAKSEITVSFDIGHSSIGWCALFPSRPHPEILGCGTVIFPKDDCLASSRRGHRRTRRNIRATRQRIARMRKLLLHLGVLDASVLDAPGHPAPHVLAARALLTDRPSLSWQELWHVLRWYAHNRGYDGNARWSREEPAEDDTAKEQAAKHLMDTHGTPTMAETVCAVLGINPQKGPISSNKPFKTLNAAFPRKVVRDEVLTILRKHEGKLPKLDANFIECLVQQEKDSPGCRSIPVQEIKLPRRYHGGLLFGQLVPRFDNRIISICPISGSKVPNKFSREFLEYRWTMLLANIKVDGRFLDSQERVQVDQLMKKQGRLTPTELRKFVETLTGSSNSNIKASFEIHPDSKDALILDPVTAFREKASQPPPKKSRFDISHFWPHLPEIVRKRAEGRWRKHRLVNLNWMREQLQREGEDTSKLDEAIDSAWTRDQAKKPQFLTREHMLRKSLAPEWPSGRAPYSRVVMKQVVDYVLTTDGHPTEVGGPIYRSPDVLKAERERPLTDQTNNHLIRQRLLILKRLTRDIIKHYADGQSSRITDIVVEVARDIQEMSGKNSQDKKEQLKNNLFHFSKAVDWLEGPREKGWLKSQANAGRLIRKAQLALDQNCQCIITGMEITPTNVDQFVYAHIIPRSLRVTDSMHALILTSPEINNMMGARTVREFIEQEQSNQIPGTNQSVCTFRMYEERIKKIGPETRPRPSSFRKSAKFKSIKDAQRGYLKRCSLNIAKYEPKNLGFTEGDLTQTSHLNRLAQQQIEKQFTDPETGACPVRLDALPGQVTAEARKAWNLIGTLVPACPECEGKTKTEIRDITHLHHALDAATLGLIHHYLPGRLPGQKENEKGLLWRALLQRKKSDSDIALLMRTGVFKLTEKTDRDGSKRPDAMLIDLPPALKNQLAARLAEARVVQHIPADQSGAALELNPWRVWAIHGDPDDPRTLITIRQRSSKIENGIRKFENKVEKLRAGKLVGLMPGKLQKNKAVLVISENYGLALEPSPQIIPFHQVSRRLRNLKSSCGKTQIPILRKGMLILVQQTPPGNKQDYTGIWRIDSCKDNKLQPALDIIRPSYIKPANGVEWAGMNKNIGPFVKAGLEIVVPPLTGLNPSD